MIETLGRYQVEAEIGHGAMGTVYKARDPLLGRVVAIKTISLHLPKDEVAEYEARFYQEAKAAGQLSHSNIVTIYDIGKSNDLAYMAMEYLEGQELRQMLSADTAIPIEKALDIGAQVAEGLYYAHERQVVHRDVKPANIMVLENGLIKITDFGIARMRNNEVKTMTGMILGSPKYMSPEQVAGKRTDRRSDIFSIGVVVYEMLTGASPFVADNLHGIMYQTLNFNPPAPKTLNPDLPQVANYIIAKVLAKNLDDRYQSAKDLANDLRRARAALTGGETHADLIASLPGKPRPFVAPLSPLTRKGDRGAATTKVDDDEDATAVGDSYPGATDSNAISGPVLGLAGGFDSYDATMRLAAMTGMEHNLDEFSDSQQIEHLIDRSRSGHSSELEALPNSGTWRKETASPVVTGTVGTVDRKLRNIWIGSAILLLSTCFVFVYAG
jgi:serine/threonine protein kinase